MSDQKTVEELTRELNKVNGEVGYYQNLAGRYRQENHKNYTKARKFRILFYFALSLAVLNLAVVIILGLSL